VLAREAAPGTRCLVIGEAGLIEALEGAGFDLTQRDGCEAAYVVVGLDRQLSFEKLKQAARAIWNGAQLISSNPDLVYPDADGLIPASGAIQAALEAATGVQARVIGKPELPGFQIAVRKLGCEPARTAILGDQLEVDILGGLRAGMLTCLVLSSITPSFSPEAAPCQPHRVFESTLDFYQHWTAENGIDLRRLQDEQAGWRL
jgi:ribonucleotide monophosphatase NagD (HAD superfamily)